MAAQSKVVDQTADELYGLPPAEFTRARDERAKVLRKEGQREEADAVKALRKPTVAAWALNQLARRRPKEIEGLIAAGEELRGAQEELLAGGDRKTFQSAATRERDEVATLARQASELTSEAGERPSPALTEKVAATLHAAALDDQTAEELRAGRLVREREAIGGFGAMSAEAPARSRGGPAKRSESAKGRGARAGGATGRSARGGDQAAGDEGKRGKPASGDATRGKAASGEARRGRATSGDATRGRATSGDATRGQAASGNARRAKAAAEDAKRRQRLAGARTDERHARRQLDTATKAIEHAETRSEAARAHAEEANRRAETTAERLKEARREHAAAKKAHARAERDLKAAERDS